MGGENFADALATMADAFGLLKSHTSGKSSQKIQPLVYRNSRQMGRPGLIWQLPLLGGTAGVNLCHEAKARQASGRHDHSKISRFGNTGSSDLRLTAGARQG